MLHNLISARLRDPIQAQAVCRRVHLGQQLALQGLELRHVQPAFEDGLLHPLPSAFAHLGNPAQTAPAGPGFGVDVVADQHQHAGRLLGYKGDIRRAVVAHGAGQQTRLHQRHHAQRHGLGQERVIEFVLLPFLESDDDGLAGFGLQ